VLRKIQSALLTSNAPTDEDTKDNTHLLLDIISEAMAGLTVIPSLATMEFKPEVQQSYVDRLTAAVAQLDILFEPYAAADAPATDEADK
jgi:hypothetical protein